MINAATDQPLSGEHWLTFDKIADATGRSVRDMSGPKRVTLSDDGSFSVDGIGPGKYQLLLGLGSQKSPYHVPNERNFQLSRGGSPLVVNFISDLSVDIGTVSVQDYDSLWRSFIGTCLEMSKKTTGQRPTTSTRYWQGVPESSSVLLVKERPVFASDPNQPDGVWTPGYHVMPERPRATFQRDLRFLICVSERLVPRGLYLGGVTAYQLNWDIWLSRVGDGALLGSTTLTVEPTQNIIVPKDGPPPPRAGIPSSPVNELGETLSAMFERLR